MEKSPSDPLPGREQQDCPQGEFITTRLARQRDRHSDFLIRRRPEVCLKGDRDVSHSSGTFGFSGSVM